MIVNALIEMNLYKRDLNQIHKEDVDISKGRVSVQK